MMEYTIIHDYDHYAVFGSFGQFLFSADTRAEAEEDIEEIKKELRTQVC